MRGGSGRPVVRASVRRGYTSAEDVPVIGPVTGRAAAARVLELGIRLACDPWTGPVRRMRPAGGDPVNPSWPGLLYFDQPMEPVSAPAPPPARETASSAAGTAADSSSGSVAGIPGLPLGLLDGAAVKEVMDASYSYPPEDPSDPQSARLTSAHPDHGRLTADGESHVLRVLVARIEAHEQVAGWHRAQQYKAIAQAAQLPVPPSSSGPLPDGVDLTAADTAAAEVGALLHISPRTARTMVANAISLTTLPKIMVLFEAGLLDENRALGVARAMADHLAEARYPDPRWVRVEERIAARAPSRTLRQLIDDIRRAVIAVDAELAEQRRQKVRQDREIRVHPEPDGMASLYGYLPAEGAAIIDKGLDLMADATRDHNRIHRPDDERTHQQRRVDALIGLFSAIVDGRPLPYYPANLRGLQHPPFTRNDLTPPWLRPSPSDSEGSARDCGPSDRGAGGADGADGADGGTSDGSDLAMPDWGWTPPWVPGGFLPPAVPEQQQRRKPHLVVTVHADTLAGCNDLPGDLLGYGAITPHAARDLARQCGSATFVILPSRPASPGSSQNAVPAPRSATVYRPSSQLVREVTAIHRTCRFPGCARPATLCDLDHVERYNGANTTAENLVPLCRAHHILKTHAGWKLEKACDTEDPGTVSWTSPSGRRYIIDPDDQPGTEPPF